VVGYGERVRAGGVVVGGGAAEVSTAATDGKAVKVDPPELKTTIVPARSTSTSTIEATASKMIHGFRRAGVAVTP
jgi:uncharacterized protein (DUF736 family)